MKDKFVLIDADYTLIENKPVVLLFCKDAKGQTVLVQDSTFEPYFYAMPKQIDKLKKKIEKLDLSKEDAKIIRVERIEKLWAGERKRLLKIVVDNPRKIPAVRDAIKNWKEVEETYEYAMPYYKRYIIDKRIEPTNWIEVEGEEVKVEREETKVEEIKAEGYQVDRAIDAKAVKALDLDKEISFKILAFDLELAEEKGKEKIIMISIVCGGQKKVLTSHRWKKMPKYVEAVESEKAMIERFLEIVKKMDPDFICAYNSDNFDFPKLKERADELKVSLKLGRDSKPVRLVRRGWISSAKTHGRVHIDLYAFIDHILSPSLKSEVLTLDAVAQELLGIGKEKIKFKEMQKMWSEKEQLNRLAEYSLWDSELVIKLAELILPQVFAISKLTGFLPFDAARNTYSQLVEAFLMRRAFVDDVLIPNRPKTDELERRRRQPVYKGAIVIEPKKGIHSNILVFDFRSLYPTIICSHNISPETFSCRHKGCKEKNEVPGTKWHFCVKGRGFVPKHLKDLIERRKKIKEKMKKIKKDSREWKRLDNEQFALKILANSCYGYMAFFGARWYKRECGSATASFGRFYIKKTIEMAKNEGFEVLYADTDSCFLTFK